MTPLVLIPLALIATAITGIAIYAKRSIRLHDELYAVDASVTDADVDNIRSEDLLAEANNLMNGRHDHE